MSEFPQCIDQAVCSSSLLTEWEPSPLSGTTPDVPKVVVSAGSFIVQFEEEWNNLKAAQDRNQRRMEQMHREFNLWKGNAEIEKTEKTEKIKKSDCFEIHEMRYIDCFETETGDEKYPLLLFTGSHYSAVTSALEACLYETKSHFDRVIVFSENPTLATRVPKHSFFRDPDLKTIEETCSRLLETQRESYKRDGQKDRILIVFDAVLQNDIPPSVVDIARKGRHYQIAWIATGPHMNSFSPAIRRQCDWIFNKGYTSQDLLTEMHREWYGAVKHKSLFVQLYNHYAANPSNPDMFIVSCQRSASHKPQDRVFWFRTIPPPADFRAGNDEQWTATDPFYLSSQQKQVIVESPAPVQCE